MENNKRRALGRGLEELFYNEPIAYDKMEERILTETPKEEIKYVKIDELRSNPYQGYHYPACVRFPCVYSLREGFAYIFREALQRTLFW